MTAYPGNLKIRWPQDLAALMRRVRSLEARTAAIDSGMPLAMLPAQIDPAYSGTGDPQVYANGSTTLTGPYNHLASYTPTAGDLVLIAPIPLTAQGGSVTSYVILGKIA